MTLGQSGFNHLMVLIVGNIAHDTRFLYNFPMNSFLFQAAWLCLAEIGSSSNKLDHSFVVKSWNEYSQGIKGISY